MQTIGILGSGPEIDHPHLMDFTKQIDLWIGVDRGALTLINNDIEVHYAIGDFDSVNEEEKQLIHRASLSVFKYSIEKDQTDLEIAIEKALSLKPKQIYLFGVTGGRMDHTLINIQLLLKIVKQEVRGLIIDQQNIIELTLPKLHYIKYDHNYPIISFIPYSQYVTGLTLTGFYYPLTRHDLTWGSTLCLSNKLLSNSGTFSYEEGILLLIKSRDSSFTIPK